MISHGAFMYSMISRQDASARAEELERLARAEQIRRDRAASAGARQGRFLRRRRSAAATSPRRASAAC